MNDEELRQWHQQQANQTHAVRNQAYSHADNARANADDIHAAHMRHAAQQQQVQHTVSEHIIRAAEGARVQQQRIAYEQQHHVGFWPDQRVTSYNDVRNQTIQQHNDWRAQQPLWYRITHRKW